MPTIKRKLDVYGYTIHMTDSVTAARKLLKSEFGEDYVEELPKDYRGGMVLTKHDKRTTIILVTERVLSTLCHEAVHVAHDVAEGISGNPLGDSEPYAYIADWTFREFLINIWKRKDG